MSSPKSSVLDWKPWMTVALVASGFIAVAAYVGPRPAIAGPPVKPKG